MPQKVVFNPVHAEELQLLSNGFDEVSSDPATGVNGQTILNNTDHTIKVWYASQWQTIHTLTTASILLLENGDYTLLENGDYLLLEA